MPVTRAILGVELTFASDIDEWQREVKQRAGGKCELNTGAAEDAHHLIGKGFKMFRLCIENGFAMAHDTHMKYHNEAGLADAMETHAPDRLKQWDELRILRNRIVREGIKPRDL